MDKKIKIIAFLITQGLLLLTLFLVIFLSIKFNIVLIPSIICLITTEIATITLFFQSLNEKE